MVSKLGNVTLPMNTTLRQRIIDWDGKSKDEIEKVYLEYSSSPQFASTLIGLCSDESINVGATWLLKHGLEQGLSISNAQTGNILKTLSNIIHWEAQLHILQCLPFFKISKTDKSSVESFLRVTITSSNKFVRAWSYNGFYVLSQQYPEYIEETQLFFDMAMRDEAASVKARIRNLMKNGFHQ